MIIDVHSHMILPSYLEGLKQMHVDPEAEDGFPSPVWTLEQHLQFMQETGITKTILSLSSPHIHHGDDAKARQLARQINEETAAICQKYPDKFNYAAVLPLPDVHGSLDEIQYNYDKLGAVAVKAASNNHGVYLGDERLDPVFAELNRRQAVVIIHPTRPEAVPEHVFTAGPIPLFEFIADTTRTVIDLIAKGTLEKYPQVKVVVPHCGSFLPFLVQRLEGITKILADKKRMAPINVQAGMKNLYFDVAGMALPVALPSLLKITTPDHLFYGSDYPYTPDAMIQKLLKDLEDYEPIQPYLQDILANNAKKLFHLTD